MKKLKLFSLLFLLCLTSYSQLKVSSGGKVAFGGAPTNEKLTIRDANANINFINGNNHEFILGNYTTSNYGAPNTFQLFDKTSNRLLMEFRQDFTFIHNRLVLEGDYNGQGRLFRSEFGSSNEASNFRFNLRGTKGFLFENTLRESSGFYCDDDFAVIWSPGDGDSEEIYGYLLKVIDEDGMRLKWYLDGNGTAYTNSDKNRKENITKISSSLNKIKRMNGVNYQFKKTQEEQSKTDTLGQKQAQKGQTKTKITKNHSGFIAQEIESIIPEVVATDEKGEKFVNYEGIIPYLVEAMKEQQVMIESLQSEIQTLKSSIGTGKPQKAASNTAKNSGSDNNHQLTNSLSQNTPNPFSQSTTIAYTLVEDAQNAMICIYDLNGNQLKCFHLDNRANSSITINGNELKAGMYIYALLVDGELIDTKKMILTE